MNINQDTINKGVETMKNLTRVAANLTDSKPKTPPPEKKTENMNQPHTQTVEVKVGEQGSNPKPTIIKEKSETHVHKVFPDNRELNEKECALREFEVKMEYELKMKELLFQMEKEAEDRKDRREKEEYERKERERRRERDRKTSRRLGWCAAGLGVVALGCFAYDFYTNSRSSANRRMALGRGQSGGGGVIPAEGEVK